jgi:hypothetical protein
VHVPRTEQLLEQVFVHRSGLPEWDRWPDHSTIGIPNYSAWAYFALAQAAAQNDRQEILEKYRALGDRWATLGTE